MSIGFREMMQEAELSASWSKDLDRKVGCAIFHPRSMGTLPKGFNGFPERVRENIPERYEHPAKLLYTVHAEMNAIAFCARHGVSTDGMGAAITYHPCSTCAGALINAGIRTILTFLPDYEHHRWGESFLAASQMFRETGRSVYYMNPEPEPFSPDKVYRYMDLVRHEGLIYRMRLGGANGFAPDLYPNFWRPLVNIDPASMWNWSR